MTTVAWDGRVLAADGLMMAGDTILQTDTVKLHHRSTVKPTLILRRMSGEVRVAAGAGNAAHVDAAVEWHLSGGKDPWPLSESENELTMIALTLFVRDGKVTTSKIREYEGSGRWFVVDRPMSVGSGKVYALAAMRAEVDALRALEITKDLDPTTAGITTYFDVDNWEVGAQTL